MDAASPRTGWAATAAAAAEFTDRVYRQEETEPAPLLRRFTQESGSFVQGKGRARGPGEKGFALLKLLGFLLSLHSFEREATVHTSSLK